jgi:endonuclease G, mitochondrial
LLLLLAAGNARLAVNARELGFDSFAVMVHSGITRTPLWAVEHLIWQDLMSEKGLERLTKNSHPCRKAL